jgi:hypothetical protein
MSGTILPAKHYNLELGREKDSKRNKEEDYIKNFREKRLSIKIPQNAFEPLRVFKKRYKKF